MVECCRQKSPLEQDVIVEQDAIVERDVNVEQRRPVQQLESLDSGAQISLFVTIGVVSIEREVNKWDRKAG